MGIVMILLRVFLTLFTIAFVGFIGYTMYLGLTQFFTNKKNNSSK